MRLPVVVDNPKRLSNPVVKLMLLPETLTPAVDVVKDGAVIQAILFGAVEEA